jgi:parallel beta-helix repeat protein
MMQSTANTNQGTSNLKEFCEVEPGSNIEKGNYHLRLLPIHISNNNALVGNTGRNNGVVKGQGTAEDPYVISGWRIDCFKWLWKKEKPKNDAAIWINKVDKYIVIENNLICNTFSYKDDHWFDGIDVDDSSNIVIRNNIVMDADVGISLGDSKDITVISNEVSSCYIGIATHSYSSKNQVSIYDNEVFYCGDGIRCINSNAEVFDNEVLSNLDGIVTWSDWSYIHDNFIYGSQDMGIVCLKSEAVLERNEIKYSDSWGIFIGGGPVPYVSRNSIMYNEGAGIYIAKGDVRIENNTISFNNGCGIECIDNHDEVYIYHNTISKNKKGIRPRDDTKIYFNNITSNTGFGIYAGGGNPIIHFNNIENNNYGLYRSGMLPWVNATFNWWGSADGPSDWGPGSGDSVTYEAIFKPWLKTPCPTAGPVQ